MDAVARVASPTGRRIACVIGGLLCALGVVCAVAVTNTAHAPHHPHPHIAAAAAAVLADGHGTSGRTADSAVAATSVVLTTAVRTSTVTHSAENSTYSAVVETVRTRGPPASA